MANVLSEQYESPLAFSQDGRLLKFMISSSF